MIIDLFKKSEGLFYLRDVYHVTDVSLAQVMRRSFIINDSFIRVSDNCVSVFLEETSIHPDTFDLAEVRIHCKHITTAIDEGNSIKRKGLKPLNTLLVSDSLLCKFLSENDIRINPFEHYLEYLNTRYYLPLSADDCDYEYWDKVGVLSSTLYHDHGEVEAFVSAEESEMFEYSTISRHPEILNTIGQAIMNLTGQRFSLGYKWKEITTMLLIVEFDVALKEVSYINNLKNENNDYKTYIELEPFLSKEYDRKEIPDLLWKNEWLIRSCLENANPTSDLSLICIGVKNDVILNPERIIVTEVNRNAERNHWHYWNYSWDYSRVGFE